MSNHPSAAPCGSGGSGDDHASAEESNTEPNSDYIASDSEETSDQEKRAVEPPEAAHNTDAAFIDPHTTPFPFHKNSMGAITSPVLDPTPCSPGAFKWSDSRHRCTHISSFNTIDSLSVADKSCAVLSFLEGIFFSPRCRFFVCRRCTCILGLDKLFRHMKHHHYHTLKALRKPFTWLEAFTHIKEVFASNDPLLNTNDIIKHVKSLMIEDAIPGLVVEPSALYVGCGKWLTRQDERNLGAAMTTHLSTTQGSRSCPMSQECLAWHKAQKGFKAKYLPVRLTIQLWPKTNSLWRISLPEGYIPSTDIPTPTLRDEATGIPAVQTQLMPLQASSSPVWVKEWPTWGPSAQIC